MKRKFLSIILAASLMMYSAASIAFAGTSNEVPAASETPSTSPAASETPSTSPAASETPSTSPAASETPSTSPAASKEPTATPEPTAKPVFMVMHNNFSSLIRSDKNGDRSDKNGDLVISKIQDSQGQINPVIINKDNRAMVPFRYLAEEMLGIGDYKEEVSQADNYFIFADEAIEIKYNGQTFGPQKQNEEFEIEGDKFIIENRDGSLYFPPRLLQFVFKGIVVEWDAKTGAIFFASNSEAFERYATKIADNVIELKEDYRKTYNMLYSYNFYNNPMNYSDIFMSSTGNIVSVDKQIGAETFYSGVTRIMDKLYFRDNAGNIYEMNEIDDQNQDQDKAKDPGKPIIPIIENEIYKENCYVDYVMAVGSSLYGVSTSVKGGYIGKLCKWTKHNEEWTPDVLEENSAYCPVYCQEDGYIYYAVKENNASKVYRRKVSNIYEREAIEGINKDSTVNIDFLAASDKYIAWLDNDGKLHIYYMADSSKTDFDSSRRFKTIEICGDIIYTVEVKENGENSLIKIPTNDTHNSATIYEAPSIKRLAVFDGEDDVRVCAIVDGKLETDLNKPADDTNTDDTNTGDTNTGDTNTGDTNTGDTNTKDTKQEKLM